MTTANEFTGAAETLVAEADKWKRFLNGPASGDGSIIETESGPVKTIARVVQEVPSAEADKAAAQIAAAQAAGNAGAAGVSAAASDAARLAAEAARQASEVARDVGQLTAGVKRSVADGLAVTVNGQYFTVGIAGQSDALVLYRNDAGAATEINRYPSTAALGRSYHEPAGKNKFNSTAVTPGFELYADGTLRSEANSSVSALIYVRGEAALTVSGMQDNTGFGRYYAFYAKDGTTLVSSAFIAGDKTSFTIAIPASAYWFRFSPKQRVVSAPNYAAVQLEFSSAPSAYEAFSVDTRLRVAFSDELLTPKMTKGGVGKNLFDQTKVLDGYEVYAGGSIVAQANSSVSDFIYVFGGKSITISGLQVNPGIGRYYVFYGSDKATIVGSGNLPVGSAGGTLMIPVNAYWFRFSPKQRNTDPASYGTVQIESGSVATAYEAYVLGVVQIDGMPLSSGSSGGVASRAENLIGLAFGDSITQTNDVDGGIFTGDAFRSNWPKFAKSALKMRSLSNYAKSGASYRNRAGLTNWQRVPYQVQQAVSNGAQVNLGFFGAGTNDAASSDWMTYLGDFDTAMGKAMLSDLNLDLIYESLRWCFWTAALNWPDATWFVLLPLQRADKSTSSLQPLYDAITRMAKEHNFHVVDCTFASGIVRQFEVWNMQGRRLVDGLHPDEGGQLLQSNCVCSKVRNVFNY